MIFLDADARMGEISVAKKTPEVMLVYIVPAVPLVAAVTGLIGLGTAAVLFVMLAAICFVILTCAPYDRATISGNYLSLHSIVIFGVPLTRDLELDLLSKDHRWLIAEHGIRYWPFSRMPYTLQLELLDPDTHKPMGPPLWVACSANEDYMERDIAKLETFRHPDRGQRQAGKRPRD